MTASRNLFWDSCVFIRYVTQDSPIGLNHLDAIVADTRAKPSSGCTKIHFSTLVYAEFLPRHLKAPHTSVRDFIKALGAQFEPIDPNPIILLWAGELRDAHSVNPNGADAKKRVISTPDAIHLATCIYVRDVMGVKDIVFQSFDEGKHPTGDDRRTVPPIGFEKWFPEQDRTPRVKEVCSLEREIPTHPNPGLNFYADPAST